MAYDIDKIRADFPILSRKVNDKPLVYLDSGASSQKPQVVIDAVTNGYAEDYSNVHRGMHYLSNLSTDKYESVRGKVASFLNAPNESNIIFTSGATHGINMISYSWAMPQLNKGDQIILSVMEHHANIVPWHFLRERLGVELVWVDINEHDELDPQAVLDAITPKTKLIAVTHMSNVLGTVVDVKSIVSGAHEKGVPVLVDGSQSSVHMPLDITDIDPDFYVVTGHKLYGPSASGAVYVKSERMSEMQPFMGGGDMIREVRRDSITWNTPPMLFEAGTPNIVSQIGFGVALDYMMGIGMENIAAHEVEIRNYASAKLEKLDWLQIQGNSKTKGAIFSFIFNEGAHAHDISTVLDKKGIAVRTGHHCAHPLMQHLGVPATCRASCGMYTSKQDIDALVEGLEFCHELFG